jgi:hypothetical protein
VNSPNRGNKPLSMILAALLLLVSVPAPGPLASDQTSRELEMSVLVDPPRELSARPPKFRVELRNIGDHDLILNLGIMLANGRRQYADAIVLTIVDPQGKTRQFALKGPGMIAGRVDPLIVPLPVASAFSISVDLDNYWAASSQEFDYRFGRGAYLLEAQFTGKGLSQQEANLDVKGLALMPYWKGTVTSNQLSFKVGK